jgi:N-carbamoylputrescine amidase
VLNGAELLFYPTAIGSEPTDHSYDSSGHWTRTMQGHSAANMVPVIASNRVGIETFESSSITFYGKCELASCTQISLKSIYCDVA